MKLNYYNYFEKRAVIILSLLLISAFGPYLLPAYGIRLEHFVIYPVFIILIFNSVFINRIIKINRYSLSITLFWIIMLLHVIIVTVNNGKLHYNVLSDIENLLQPIAIIIILGWMSYGLNYYSKQKLLERSCWLIAIMLSINALFGLLSIFFDTWPIVRYFVGVNEVNNDVLGSVWGRSASMGRFIGIFNQPFEAGVAYSLAAIGIIYIVNKKKKFSTLLVILLILVTIGGLLTVSKVFVIGGILLVLIYLIWTKKILKIFSLRLILAISTTVYLVVINIQNWQGFWYLKRLFTSDMISYDTAINPLTSGRYSSGSSNFSTFNNILNDSPIFGYGIVNPNVTIDNGLLYYFFHGGFIGLLLYIGILISILFIAILGIVNKRMEGKFLLLIFLLIIGSDLGAPTAIINRSSIFLWVLVYLGICINTQDLRVRKMLNQSFV